MRHFTGSQCVYRKSTRIRSHFHLSALPRSMANCTYALTVLLRLLAGCVHRHPTGRGTFGGRRQRNKQNGYCAQGPARSLLGLCSLGLQPWAHPHHTSMLDRIHVNASLGLCQLQWVYLACNIGGKKFSTDGVHGAAVRHCYGDVCI
jgi:hypothetical protein